MADGQNAGQGLETANFKITGICGCEIKIVEKKIKNLTGIKSYTVNPVTSQLKVTYDASAVNIEGIMKAVSKAGAKATLMKPNQLL